MAAVPAIIERQARQLCALVEIADDLMRDSGRTTPELDRLAWQLSTVREQAHALILCIKWARD